MTPAPRVRRLAVTIALVGIVLIGTAPLGATTSLFLAQQHAIGGSDPVDLTVDATGIVYVLDGSDGTVRTFAPVTHAPGATFPVPDPATPWRGIAVAESPTRLVFIDETASSWAETALDGTGAIISPIIAPRADVQVLGLTFDPDDGTLWATDAAHDIIDQYTGQGAATGVAIAQPASLIPGFDAVDGGVAALAGSDCFEVAGGSVVDGGAVTRFRVNASGLVEEEGSWAQLGLPPVRGIAWEQTGVIGQPVLFAVSAAPSMLWAIEGTPTCAPCSTDTVTALTATPIPGIGIDLDWTAPPSGGVIRILRDGVGLTTLPPGTVEYLDATATGFHVYEVATTVAGLGCPGPRVAANLIPADTVFAPAIATAPVDVAVAAGLDTAWILDADLGGAGVSGAVVVDLALVPTGTIPAPPGGGVLTGIAHEDGGTPSDPTDDLLHWRNETLGLVQSTDLAGALVAEFIWQSPTGGPIAGLDRADLDCGPAGFVARDVGAQTLHFFDATGAPIATPIALAIDPGDFGTGIARIETAGGYEVPLGSTPPGFVDEIRMLDCAGTVFDSEPLGPTSEVPVDRIVALDVYLDPVTALERRLIVTEDGDGWTTGIEPRPCDDPDGVPCDLDLLATCVTLGWTSVPSLTSIEVYRDATMIATLPGTATSYTDCPSVSATYGYSIVTVCSTGARSDMLGLCKLCVGVRDGKHRIADLDRGGAHRSVLPIEAALASAGEESTRCAELAIGEMEDAPTIWVLLGTYPDNHVLTPEEGNALAYYAATGIPIYIEGGDAWGFDPATDFACYDGVDDDLAIDTVGPITTLEGSGEFAGLLTNYTPDQGFDDLNDGLFPATADLGGAVGSVLWTSTGSGVAQPVSTITQSGPSKVIASSFEIGGLPLADQEALAFEVFILLTTHADIFFTRGDCNQDGGTDIADAINLLGQLFQGTAASSCPSACDANDDGALDIADPIAILAALFTGGVIPEPTNCGAESTPDALSPSCNANCP